MSGSNDRDDIVMHRNERVTDCFGDLQSGGKSG